jgi:hypothetical protein
MRNAFRRINIVAAAMLTILVCLPRAASAATITVEIVPVTQTVTAVEISPGTTVTVQRSTMGNVLFAGSIVGTYVMKQSFDIANSTSTTTAYPTPLTTITLRLNPPIGTHFDTLVMVGLAAGTTPNPDQITTFGNVTVATGTLAFLRGATFTTAVAVGNTPLTFTY